MTLNTLSRANQNGARGFIQSAEGASSLPFVRLGLDSELGGRKVAGMKFTDDQIDIRPGHCARTWQSCDYYLGNTELFHERTFTRTLPPAGHLGHSPAALLWAALGPGCDNAHQWLPGHGTQAEIEALAAKVGGTAHALETFYPPETGPAPYFLAFRDTDEALAFCRTADFDKLCLTMEKHT